MKIILREYVEHLGEPGEIVAVAPGYARNFLLPKGLALRATPGNLKQIETQKRAIAAREMKEVTGAEAAAARIGDITLEFKRRAGETGTLYGSVTNSELAAGLQGKGVEVDRRRIVLSEPIKALGEYEVPVKLHRKVTGQLKVHVLREGKAPAPIEEVEGPEDAEDGED